MKNDIKCFNDVTSFYFSWHSMNNKDKTILVSIYDTKCKIPEIIIGSNNKKFYE